MYNKTICPRAKAINLSDIFPNIQLYIFLSLCCKPHSCYFVFFSSHDNFICNTKHKLPALFLWKFIASPSKNHFLFICIFNLIRIPPLIFPILIQLHNNFFVLPGRIFLRLRPLLNVRRFCLCRGFCCLRRCRSRADSHTKRHNQPGSQFSFPSLFLHTFNHSSSS